MKFQIGSSDPEEEIIEIGPKKNYRKIFSFVAAGALLTVIIANVLGVPIFGVKDNVESRNIQRQESLTGFIGSAIDKIISGEGEELVEIIDLNTGEVTKFDTQDDPSAVLVNGEDPVKSFIKECDFNSSDQLVSGHIKINEVAWMGSKSSANDEWIELKNISNGGIDISGWHLIDKDEQIKIKFSTGTIIKGGDFYLLERGEEAAIPKADVIYSGSLKNNDEALRLFNADCVLIDGIQAKDKWPAGDNLFKTTMERADEGWWYSSMVVGGTPKFKNSDPMPPYSETSYYSQPSYYSQSSYAPTAPEPESIYSQSSYINPPPPQPPPSPTPVTAQNPLINEILFDPTGSDLGKEFIELYNPTGADLDLKDWSLRLLREGDVDSTSLAKFGFGSSGANDKTLIKNGRFFLVGLNNYSGTPTPDVKRSAVLPNTSGTIYLLNVAGETIETVYYSNTVVVEGSSLERQSWSSDNFLAQPAPNPQNSD